MVKLSGTLSHFRPINVLLCGDLMLDQYTQGKVTRISPEAPVPIMHVIKDWAKPGGAGNVMRNLLALGAKVRVLGRVGEDQFGKHLVSFMQREGADIDFVLQQSDYATPVKNRLIAEGQQIIRIDHEKIIPLSSALEESIMDNMQLLLEDVNVVVISDYQKGFMTERLLHHLIAECNEQNIPVIIDPKGKDFSKYAHATIIKPNQKEAYIAANCSSDVPLEEVAEHLLQITHVQYLLITRSNEGMTLFNRHGQRWDFPVRVKEVNDVTGAGDTVLAFISFAYANGLDISIGAQLANIAAGIAIEHLGCAVISLSDFAQRLLEYDVDNKVFDAAHLYALKEVLKKTSVVILGINTKEGIHTALLQTIQSLSQENHSLLLYIQDASPDEEVIDLLALQKEVDFILLHSENLRQLISEVSPAAVYEMQKDHSVLLKDPKILLQTLRKKMSRENLDV